MATVHSTPLIPIEPVARNLMSVHPNDDGTDDDNVSSSVLSQTPKFNIRSSSINGNIIKTEEIWRVRQVIQGQEELYARGKCVYWTRNSIIIKSFNFTEQVIKVFWAEFKNKDHICVALVSGLSIFDRTGQHFQIPLPFVYQEIYPSKCGLLIERSCYQLDDPLPILSALTHPTHEVSPILFKLSNAVQNNNTNGVSKGGDLFNNDQMHHGMPYYMSIVACHDNLPLCLVYNSQGCHHSLWLIDQVSDEESDEYQRLNCDQSTLQTTFTGHQMSTSISIRDQLSSHHNSPASINLSNKQRSSLMMHPSNVMSGIGVSNFSPKVDNLRSSRQSLSLGSLAASRLGMGGSQITSDANNSNMKSLSSHHTINMNTSPNRARIINYLRDNIEEPILPELKLEQIWVESSSNSLKAEKFFSYTDFAGINYLVIVTPASSQLKVLKCDPTKLDSGYISGRASFITAIDATPLYGIKMMLVVDSNRNMILYSGFDKIAQLTVPLLYTSTMRALTSSSPANPRQTTIDLTPIQLSSARKRSSLSDRSHIGQDTSMQHLFQTVSPVPHKNDHAKFSTPIAINEIKRLDQVVGNHVYIINQAYNRGKFTIPSICQTSTIGKLLDAIKMLSSRDIALYCISTWYQARRSSSQPELMNARNELNLFKEWLLNSLGVTGIMFQDSSPNKTTNNEFNEPDFSVRFSHQSPTKKTRRTKDCGANPMMANIHSIFYAIHLVFEDILLMKLNYELANSLAELLIVLACILRLDQYQNYYWLKFPNLKNKFGPLKKNLESINATLWSSKEEPAYFSDHPPSVMDFINKLIAKSKSPNCYLDEALCPYPNIRGVTQTSMTVISLFSVMFNIDPEYSIVDFDASTTSYPWKDLLDNYGPARSRECDINVVNLMMKLEKKRNFLASLPLGLNLYLWDSILNCRHDPPTDWTGEHYNLIGRMDLVSLVSSGLTVTSAAHLNNSEKDPLSCSSSSSKEDHDPDETIRLIFPDDIRVAEAHRMLASDAQLEFSINSRPGATDDEIRNETTRMIYLLNIRTMGMPVGRGAMGLHTYSPVIGESFEVPRLELSAKSLTEERPMDFNHDPSVYPWPFFHNGVAAGLRICASTSNNIIDSTWINYNRPRSNITPGDMRDRDVPLPNMNNEHAGFLFALGLSGHLEKLSQMALHDYLCQNNDLTKLAILLGMSAAKRGTRDNNIIKVLSIHVDALLPPNSTELDVPPPVHAASIMGVGLLYQGSGDSHISKVLLEEIGRTPGPESNSHVDRESYSLSAGLAFGLVNLCKGGSTTISSSDQLREYMLGGRRKPFTIAQKDRYLKQDCHRGEEEYINTHITGPSGTLGLGLMHHRSGNTSVANWMRAPDTQKLLEHVRPDHLMLRMIAYGLIMWDEIEPSEEFINRQIPAMIFTHAFQRHTITLIDNEKSMLNMIDYELISQSYCCIVAGCCMAIALRFAGTADQRAYKTIYRHLKFLMQLNSKPSMIEQAGRACIESCLNVLITALAVVMAGTGDLGVMRACRYLRSRLTHSCIFYGSYMAIHMALGLLFLGNCRYSLKTSPEAIGALVCALYPVYPSHTSDNRYHLQALRHLYVLATEPRLLIPRDIETGKPVYVNITVRLKPDPLVQNKNNVVNINKPQRKTSSVSSSLSCDQDKEEIVIMKLKAPCLLPEMETILSVHVDDERYWRIEINKMGELTRCLIQNLGHLNVKHKAHSSNNQLVQDIEKFILKDMKPGVMKSRKSTALKECVKEDRVEQFAALNQLLTKFHTIDKRFKSILLEQIALSTKLSSDVEGATNLTLSRPIIDELSEQLNLEKGMFTKWASLVQGITDWTSSDEHLAEYIVLNDLKCNSIDQGLLAAMSALSY